MKSTMFYKESDAFVSYTIQEEMINWMERVTNWERMFAIEVLLSSAEVVHFIEPIHLFANISPHIQFHLIQMLSSSKSAESCVFI